MLSGMSLEKMTKIIGHTATRNKLFPGPIVFNMFNYLIAFHLDHVSVHNPVRDRNRSHVNWQCLHVVGQTTRKPLPLMKLAGTHYKYQYSFRSSISLSPFQLPGQHNQPNISPNAKSREEKDAIPAGTKLAPDLTIVIHRGKKLLVALVSTVHRAEKHRRSINGEERAYSIELRGKDLEYDQSKAELGKGRSHVRSFESPLCSSYLYQPV